MLIHILRPSSVRTTRTQIIRLRNDHKDVMTHLEKRVHEQFANLQRAQGSTTANVPNGTNGTNGTRSDSDGNSLSNTGASGPAFATVNSVVAASPADQAGLKAGDTIRSFGTVNWMNHERLTKVAELVQQNEGVSIPSSDRSCVQSYWRVQMSGTLASSPLTDLVLANCPREGYKERRVGQQCGFKPGAYTTP